MRLPALIARATLIALTSLPVLASPAAESRREVGPADFVPVLTPAPGQTQVHVPAFHLDERPVTNAQFLGFVSSHPEWQRDRIASLFADEGYLSHWATSGSLGAQARADQPVTRVSWFAARAYCAAMGGRLPEWNEWELAAAADERLPDARTDPAWRARILDWYARPATDTLEEVGRGRPNFYGIHDLHGLIWEWVEDYNSLMVSGDSRDQGDPDKLEFCGASAISAQDRENYPVLMRIAFLSALEARSTARRLGFRCATGGAGPAQAGTGPSTAALPGGSLYQLPVSLETADGTTIPLSALHGKPLLVTLFYGRCSSVCPILTNQLQILDRHLAPRTRAHTRVLMVSLDSANDSPAELSVFRQQHHIRDSRWIIARTTPEAVRLLAAALGVRYRQLPDQSFNHSTTIALADPEGLIRARTSGVQSSSDELAAAANSMARGVATNRPGDASPPLR